MSEDAGYWLWSGSQLALLVIAALIAGHGVTRRLRPDAAYLALLAIGLAGSGLLQNTIQGQLVGFMAVGIAIAFHLLRSGHMAAVGGALAVT